MDLSFHVPTSNTQFVGDENRPPAHVSSLSKHCLNEAHWSCKILTNENLSIFCRFYGRLYWNLLMLVLLKNQLSRLTELQFLHQGGKYEPFTLWETQDCWAQKANDFLFWQYRGRYSVELHLSFLRLQGQANDFKIQYSSIVRLFLLPKVLFLYPILSCALLLCIILHSDTKPIAWLSFAVKQSSYVCCYHSWSTNP